MKRPKVLELGRDGFRVSEDEQKQKIVRPTVRWIPKELFLSNCVHFNLLLSLGAALLCVIFFQGKWLALHLLKGPF